MKMDLSIHRQALRVKGKVNGRKIIAHPDYSTVCFTHAVHLAVRGVKIIEFVDE